jgi:hypothetical protein
VVNGAAMSVVKLLVQSKASSFIGGGNSGGMGSLLGMVSRIIICFAILFKNRD